MSTLYSNLSLYINLTVINYIRQEEFCKTFSSLSYIRRISGLVIANAMYTLGMSYENTPEGRTETCKSSFFPYKQVSGKNGDHE